jgi:alkylation response protein AidB-like acyl-CoA dehydrogenase
VSLGIPMNIVSPLQSPSQWTLDALIAAADELGKEFARDAAAHDASGILPAGNFDALAAAGLLRFTIARADGGYGAGLSEAIRVVGAIARGEPSTALVLAMHYVQHAAIARGHRWPAALARRVVESSFKGVALINALQVEPEAGSPSYGTLPRTTARVAGDTWRISGRKRYSTGSALLAWMVVNAVTDEAEPRLGSFVVPRSARGVHIIETWNTIGMRATGSHDVVLEDVVIPYDHAFELTPASEGVRRDGWQTSWFMALIGAVYDGIARAARDAVVDFAKNFSPGNLGSPLAALPGTQDEIGAIEIRLDTSERLLQSLARDVDGGRVDGAAAAMVRQVVIENAVAVTMAALALGGNHGISRINALERHHRDALCGRAHAPGAGLVRTTAGRLALGLAPAMRFG